MKRIAWYVLILMSLSSAAFAQSAQEMRGLEEEKREFLSYTEVRIAPRESASLPEGTSPELRFLNELYSRHVAHVADVERVLSLLTGRNKQEEIVETREPLRKGAAALMFCRKLGIRGGVWMRVFGASERYALRELVHEGIMAAEGVEELVTGQELVDMFVRAVDYMEKQRGRLKK